MNALGYELVRKSADPGEPKPVLESWEFARRTFSWQRARAALEGLPGGRGLNIAHVAVDRWAKSGKVALRWLGRHEARRDISYELLSELTNRFANVLRHLGVRRCNGWRCRCMDEAP